MASRHRARRWLLAWCVAALAAPGACFDPSYPVGLPCSEIGSCPPGQRCDLAAGVCRAGGPVEPDPDGGPIEPDRDSGPVEPDRDGDGVPASADCDDGDAMVHPGAVERCNARDDDCNGAVDDAAGEQWFTDRDADGFGDDATAMSSCTGEGLVARGGDCDDGDGAIHPDADERCDERDNDCDGAVDGADAIDASTWYADADGDAHGDAASTLRACVRPEGYASEPGDCDDGNASAHPGGVEQCDAVDQDCDGDPANGVLGDAPACAAADCRTIAAERTADGVYFIDPDGAGATAPYPVFCSVSMAGGGWQLVSSRTQDIGALFANAVCLDPGVDCSGTIPAVQRVPGAAPDLLFATSNGAVWIRLTGLLPPGGNALLDVIVLARPLGTSDSCEAPHYCGLTLDPALAVHSSSSGYTPRFTALTSQYSRVGGLWFGNGGGGGIHHVLSLNYSDYCAPGGLDLSDARNGTLGNVVCGQPGGIYFQYPPAPASQQQ